MKALCVYVAAGMGHRVPCVSVATELESMGIEAKTVEFFDFFGIAWLGKINRTYWRLSLRFPSLERICSARNDSNLRLKKAVVNFANKHLGKRFLREINEFNPDFIFTTHPYASTVISSLTENMGKGIPTYYYATDVFAVPNWAVSNDLRKILVSTAVGRNSALSKGQEENRVEIVPFPIRKEFAEIRSITKKEARGSIGLNPDLFTVQINLGGEGIGNINLIADIAKETKSFQAVIIGLTSSIQMAEINRLNDSGIKVLSPGFTQNPGIYMAASDVIVGRAGVNTICEAIYLHRPFLVTDVVYTVIDAAAYVEKHGIGWNLEGDRKAQVEKLLELIGNPGILDNADNAFGNIEMEFGTRELAEILVRDALSCIEAR